MLTIGSVIRKINGEEVKNIADYEAKKQALKRKSGIVILYVESQNREGYIYGQFVALRGNHVQMEYDDKKN